MAGYNDITGAHLVSKASTREYVNNYDGIFKPKTIELTVPEAEVGSVTVADLKDIVRGMTAQIESQGISDVKGRLLATSRILEDQTTATTSIEVPSTVKDKLDSLAAKLEVSPDMIGSYLACYLIVFRLL